MDQKGKDFQQNSFCKKRIRIQSQQLSYKQKEWAQSRLRAGAAMGKFLVQISNLNHKFRQVGKLLTHLWKSLLTYLWTTHCIKSLIVFKFLPLLFPVGCRSSAERFWFSWHPAPHRAQAKCSALPQSHPPSGSWDLRVECTICSRTVDFSCKAGGKWSDNMFGLCTKLSSPTVPPTAVAWPRSSLPFGVV